jgi:hypothetical protein
MVRLLLEVVAAEFVTFCAGRSEGQGGASEAMKQVRSPQGWMGSPGGCLTAPSMSLPVPHPLRLIPLLEQVRGLVTHKTAVGEKVWEEAVAIGRAIKTARDPAYADPGILAVYSAEELAVRMNGPRVRACEGCEPCSRPPWSGACGGRSTFCG